MTMLCLSRNWYLVKHLRWVYVTLRWAPPLPWRVLWCFSGAQMQPLWHKDSFSDARLFGMYHGMNNIFHRVDNAHHQMITWNAPSDNDPYCVDEGRYRENSRISDTKIDMTTEKWQAGCVPCASWRSFTSWTLSGSGFRSSGALWWLMGWLAIHQSISHGCSTCICALIRFLDRWDTCNRCTVLCICCIHLKVVDSFRNATDFSLFESTV